MVVDQNVRKRPSYWVGLICVIPLIGFFAALFFLIKGLFSYRNKGFVIVGIFGVLLNVGYFSMPFLMLRYNKQTIHGFEVMSQDKLNNLVGQIEIYKKLNGGYPDSLTELKTLNSQADLVDPLQIRRFRKDINNYYEYERIGDKYTIFSVGVDGIPHTQDDLYPIVNSDSTNIGLIKR